LQTGHEEHPVRIKTSHSNGGGAMRIDPHPAWDRSWKYVAFNATPDGTASLFWPTFSKL
jgi:hypothetical protein